jgi:hypothetical protein
VEDEGEDHKTSGEEAKHGVALYQKSAKARIGICLILNADGILAKHRFRRADNGILA